MSQKVHFEHWGDAYELVNGRTPTGMTIVSSLLEVGATCEKCGNRFEAGEYARARYGPHGGTNFHDDCTEARSGDEEEVVCRLGTYCQVTGART